MLVSVIHLLIYLCVLAIAYYLVVWVLAQLGWSLPEPVMKIILVIIILLVLLAVVQTILPGMGVRLGGIAQYLT